MPPRKVYCVESVKFKTEVEKIPRRQRLAMPISKRYFLEAFLVFMKRKVLSSSGGGGNYKKTTESTRRRIRLCSFFDFFFYTSTITFC